MVPPLSVAVPAQSALQPWCGRWVVPMVQYRPRFGSIGTSFLGHFTFISKWSCVITKNSTTVIVIDFYCIYIICMCIHTKHVCLQLAEESETHVAQIVLGL